MAVLGLLLAPGPRWEGLTELVEKDTGVFFFLEEEEFNEYIKTKTNN